jgi:hypothetical protein
MSETELREAAATAEAILKHYDDRLSAWEDNFVRSMAQFAKIGLLTQKQIKKLDEIFERVSMSGTDSGRPR